MISNIKIPQIYAPLLTQKSRYKVLYSGRGTGKSWSIARAIIIKCYSEKHRVLCCREFQKSISDSVHKLLSDQIRELGLSAYFTITNDNIRSITTGSEIFFKGLHANADQIKSIEGVTLVWLEEAHSTTKESLDYLIPTIRTKDSEIWISFNAQNESDEIYQRFVINKPDNALVIRSSFADNPYFPDVLRDEMEHCKLTNYDAYKNIWLGECVSISDAVIFKNKATVKYFVDPEEADYQQGVDFGFAEDASVLIRCYELQEGSEKNLYICDEAYGLHVPTEGLPALFNQVRNSDKYVTNCDCSRPETIYSLKKYWNYLAVGEGKQKIEDRISYIMSYNNIFIHPKCTHIIEEFHNYKYKLDGNGNITRTPVDKWNHCFSGDTLILTDSGYKPIKQVTTSDRVMTRKGYKRVLKVWRNGTKAVNQYNLSGHILTATPDHNIITPKGKINLNDLTCTNDIYIWSDFLWKYIKTKNQRQSYIREILIDVTQTAKTEVIGYISGGLSKVVRNICTLPFMKNITGKLKEVTIFITRIKTLSIMISTILNLFLAQIILAIMLKNIIKNTVNLLKHTYQKFVVLHQNGTEVKKGENGTGNTHQNTQNSSEHVNNAVKSLNLYGRMQTYIAQKLVPHLFAVNRGLMTLPLFVAYVVKSLFTTNTKNRLPVPTSAVEVYDLYIEDQHEYFANGILVSNCIDALSYALFYKIRNTSSRVIQTHNTSFNW